MHLTRRSLHLLTALELLASPSSEIWCWYIAHCRWTIFITPLSS
jgi:hypothetical protein